MAHVLLTVTRSSVPQAPCRGSCPASGPLHLLLLPPETPLCGHGLKSLTSSRMSRVTEACLAGCIQSRLATRHGPTPSWGPYCHLLVGVLSSRPPSLTTVERDLLGHWRVTCSAPCVPQRLCQRGAHTTCSAGVCGENRCTVNERRPSSGTTLIEMCGSC